MIVAKSTTQRSEFLVPSQFHPQHFPVELPFQLKRISLLIYFMAIYRCPTFSVIHILPLVPIFLQIYVFLFFKPKNWQQSFSVPSKFHPQHFQVQLITFFLAHKNLPFILHDISTFFSRTRQQPKSLLANNWQIYQINFNL